MPLHSTRADVERLLGPARESSNEHTAIYHLEKEVVVIDYESDRACDSPGGWRVPAGTVLSIIVTTRPTLRFSDLRVDESRYKKSSGGHRPEDIVYTDDERGESITVYRGEVTCIKYFPAAGDNHLRCPSPRAAPDGGRAGAAYHALDIYHDLPFATEKAALDNFAINLSEDAEKKGYIVVYAGRQGPASEACARAERAKTYLVNERAIKSERVVTLYGGRREQFTVEIYVVPEGAPPPAPVPTVAPQIANYQEWQRRGEC